MNKQHKKFTYSLSQLALPIKYIAALYDYTKNHKLILSTISVSSFDQFQKSKLVPIVLINIYSLGYPYVIHKLCTSRKNIFENIDNDTLGLIIGLCIDSTCLNIGNIDYHKSRYDLVSKQWRKCVYHITRGVSLAEYYFLCYYKYNLRTMHKYYLLTGNPCYQIFFN